MFDYFKKFVFEKNDTEDVKSSKLLILIISIFCSFCALIWSLIYYSIFGFGLITSLPLFFALIIILAIFLSNFYKNHYILIHTQIIGISLIPLLNQWSIGSMNQSGFVLAWSFLSPIAALIFLTKRESYYWIGVFTFTLIFSIVFEPKLLGYAVQVSANTRKLFYIMNISAPAFITFLAARYFVNEQNNQNNQNQILNSITKAKNDEIISSIEYAKRLQESILPNRQRRLRLFPESFVFNRPKDIVSGDFFWMEEMDDIVYVAVADCTGHGVPGAMVSIICMNALERAIKEFKLVQTGEILDKVSDLVVQTFIRSKKNVKDGMDISLLSINKKSRQIQWSGANNQLIYFIDNTLHTLKPDRQAVGFNVYRKVFTSHSIEYKDNTTFYLFTDGYLDQFGGVKDKKFTIKQFRLKLTQSVEKSPKSQKAALNRAFEDWKGKNEQVDDVCVLGLKI